MASPNSAKKAARIASKSGSNSSGKKQANWLFPLGIVVIVAMGIGLVAFARSQGEPGNSGANDTPPRAQLNATDPFDHWHAAFAINVCGKELTPLHDTKADTLGIHTHEDGLIHIHPFSTQSAGKKARLDRFFDQTGLKVSPEKVTLQAKYNGADSYRSGKDTCGGKKSQWVLAHWKNAETAATQKPDAIFKKDFGSVLLSEDLGAYTLAFLPDGSTSIPAPATAVQIRQLGAIDGGSSTGNAPSQNGVTTPTGQPPASTPASTPATEPTPPTTAAGK